MKRSSIKNILAAATVAVMVSDCAQVGAKTQKGALIEAVREQRSVL